MRLRPHEQQLLRNLLATRAARRALLHAADHPDDEEHTQQVWVAMLDECKLFVLRNAYREADTLWLPRSLAPVLARRLRQPAAALLADPTPQILGCRVLWTDDRFRAGCQTPDPLRPLSP